MSVATALPSHLSVRQKTHERIGAGSGFSRLMMADGDVPVVVRESASENLEEANPRAVPACRYTVVGRVRIACGDKTQEPR